MGVPMFCLPSLVEALVGVQRVRQAKVPHAVKGLYKFFFFLVFRFNVFFGKITV